LLLPRRGVNGEKAKQAWLPATVVGQLYKFTVPIRPDAPLAFLLEKHHILRSSAFLDPYNAFQERR
jgi:hypothetical protein